EICEKYVRKDNRIKVIHKENGGVASARNVGLEVANGKYIGFVDNDDYINKQMLKILHENAITYSSDIVICEYLELPENHSRDISNYDQINKIKHYSNIEALNQLYTSNNITFVVPWNKLYKRYLFNSIKYKVGNINDDETIAHELLYDSKKVTHINTELYYYVQRKGSQTEGFHIKRLDAVYALKIREVFFRKKKLLDLHQK